MSKLFGGSTDDYTPTPCRIERIDGDDFAVTDWRIWSDALLECDRDDGRTVYVPLTNVAQIVEVPVDD